MELTHIAEFKKEDVLFETLPYNSQFDYERIKILKTYGDTKTGSLLVETPFLFSFGVKQRLAKKSTTVTGYSIPVCLWGKQSEPTAEEKEFHNFLIDINDLCYKKLKNKYGEKTADKMSKLLYSNELPESAYESSDCPPVLYAKLCYSEKAKKFSTLFNSKSGGFSTSPLDYIDTFCYVKMILQIESIYISTKPISIQVRAKEVYFKPLPERERLMNVEPEKFVVTPL